MRKRFIARKKTANLIIPKAIIVFIVLVLSCLAIKYLFKIVFKSANESRVNDYLAVASNNLIGEIRITDLLNINLTSPDTFLKMNLSGLRILPVNTPVSQRSKPVINDDATEPLVYIYNTHQSEDYNPGTLKEYNIVPTVYMASVMLEKALAKKNITAIVEETNIKDLLNANGWSFNESYKASKLWLEKAKNDYPSIKYFIDIHRDSVSGTVTIDDLPYAKLMLVVGMNHDKYQENEALALQIQTFFKSNYEPVIKNIFYGKNSRYNQDFDPNTFLIEVGGPNNTIDEVYNSINILANALESIIGGV